MREAPKSVLGLLMVALSLSAAVAASPVLVPAPRKMALTGGETTHTNVTRVTKAGLPAEGYTLAITPQGVTVEAADDAGFFYADMTLKQLAGTNAAGVAVLPCLTIEDSPVFGWRGLMIDDCRHFFGKAELKKMLDLMAYHKFNVLHWHLTDDQGWRLAIDKYPDLVKYGAVRPVGKGRGHEFEGAGPLYGPFFYTKDDVREILAYAKARHIRVVPEIEIPGHARAALAAYPQFSCLGSKLLPREPWTRWGISEDVICAGNDDAIRFYEDVFDEVCDLFDSPIIHCGGDECPKKRWQTCEKCQARIKAEGLKNANALQGWVTRHFADYLAKKGRRLLGWDEILEGSITSNAVVMSWRGSKGGIAAAKAGHDVVMTPNTFCYLDYRQAVTNDPNDYIGGHLPLGMVYAFDPCAGIPKDQQKHVLGGQGNNWAEYTQTPAQLEWKCWPRACALAECLWTPSEKRNYGDFLSRMAVHRARLLAMGVNAAPLK